MDSNPFVTADLSLISTPNDMPSDVYKFMIQNASSHQRSKLMESGKFFFPKEFVKINYAVIRQNKIQCFKKREDFARDKVCAELNQSLWIAKELHIRKSTDAMIRSLPKTAVWNLQYLEIISQVMSYESFKFLISSGVVEHLIMEYATIQYSNTKKEVPLENIFELLPNCSHLIFNGNVPSIASLETANIHRPSNLDSIYMLQLDEKFDFKTFSMFMINNQDVNYWITFDNEISEDYDKELEVIIAKINEAWNDQTRLPLID